MSYVILNFLTTSFLNLHVLVQVIYNSIEGVKVNLIQETWPKRYNGFNTGLWYNATSHNRER